MLIRSVIRPVLPILLVCFSALACNLTRPIPAAPSPTGKSAGLPPGMTQAPSPTLGPGDIHGVLWHDVCQFSGGDAGKPPILGEGCIRWGTKADQFGPNQVFDKIESGWKGVTIHLGTGACPAAGLATAVTGTQGDYQFGQLAAGTYCVSYSATSDGNDSILIPGAPTFPERGDSGFFQTVTLIVGESKEVNFGYAWQAYN
jgi:hypothetical protein